MHDARRHPRSIRHMLAGLATMAGVALANEADPGVDVEALSLLVAASLRGAVAQYMVDPQRVNLPRIADALIALLDRGVATQTNIHRGSPP